MQAGYSFSLKFITASISMAIFTSTVAFSYLLSITIMKHKIYSVKVSTVSSVDVRRRWRMFGFAKVTENGYRDMRRPEGCLNSYGLFPTKHAQIRHFLRTVRVVHQRKPSIFGEQLPWPKVQARVCAMHPYGKKCVPITSAHLSRGDSDSLFVPF